MPSLLEKKPDLGGMEEYLGYDIPVSGPMPLVTKMEVVKALPKDVRKYFSPVLRKFKKEFLDQIMGVELFPEQTMSAFGKLLDDAVALHAINPTVPKAESFIELFKKTRGGWIPTSDELANALIHEMGHAAHAQNLGTTKFAFTKEEVREDIANLFANKLTRAMPQYFKSRMEQALQNETMHSLLGHDIESVFKQAVR